MLITGQEPVAQVASVPCAANEKLPLGSAIGLPAMACVPAVMPITSALNIARRASMSILLGMENTPSTTVGCRATAAVLAKS